MERLELEMHLGVNTLFHVPGDIGGTETYLLELLQAIVNKYPELKITIFAQLDNSSLLKKMFFGRSQVSVYSLPFYARVRPLRILMEQTLLPLAALRSGVDVLWSPGYTAPYYSLCPQVVTVHDLQYKRHPEDLTWLERITLDLLVRSACRRCKKIIAVSEFSRKEIVYYGFAPQEKIATTMEGVDETFSIPVSEKIKAKQFLADSLNLKTPFILCVAHTYPHKNVHLLIEAFHNVKDILPHNLVLVGKKRLGERKVEEVLEQYGHSSRIVRFSQGVPFEVLKFLYQKADLFVLPSEYEGFGLPVLEALMAGTVVVCAEKASLPEIAGQDVFYVKNLNAMELSNQIVNALNTDSDVLSQIRESGQKWAKSFTWEKSATKTIRAIESAMKHGKTKRKRV